ncbi:hypothetical protein CPC08DRAFT_760148 [Agrocybe pediades]|nr:hypothetical protein CPC08DRAFT_760148 [Agrocybe pediades]
MNSHSYSQPSAPITTQVPVGTSLGMTPASRYKHNIKVLRRRDPSITSIFDQFSHVCVYHHDGQQWLKQGYEGTMFLFERESYPPYGLYVLNRVGAEDYIQGIYPEDEFVQSGKYLIIKSFPDFLAQRLANIPSAANGEPHDRFSDVYAIPNIDQLDSKMKGRSTVVGLWTLALPSREPMEEVMKRLHSCIKRNEPYPDKYRYEPDKPPPPHRLQAVPRPAAGYASDVSDSQRRSQSDYETDQGNQSDAPSAASGGMSEVEMLFKKFITPSTANQQPQTTQPTSINLNSLFASVATDPSTASRGTENPAPPPSATSSTGISLLDSIFASASSPQPQKRPTIVSPQPTISTSPPQVLNQDVLSHLLGLPSRAPSAASTFSTSASLISHPSSREGDNEDDGESDSPGGLTDPSDSHPPGKNLARMASSELLSSLGLGVPRLVSQGKINGDVTPRGPLNQSLQGRSQIPPSIESTSSIGTVRGGPQQQATLPPSTSEESRKPRANRTLVPFEPDSELWPYSRGPVDESSPTDGGEDGEIVELDFGETSVLSDPAAFDKVIKTRKSAISLKGSVNGQSHTSGSANGAGRGTATTANGSGKKNKKSRKEQQKDEIEKSWDFPLPSPAAVHDALTSQDLMYGPPASPSPCSSPVSNGHQTYGAQVPSVPEMKTPTMNANAVLGQVNGYHGPVNTASLSQKGKGKAVVNGRTKTNGFVNGLDAETATDSMLAALGKQPRSMNRLERNEFAKELLTLIQTDKAFVDTLWNEYLARSA